MSNALDYLNFQIPTVQLHYRRIRSDMIVTSVTGKNDPNCNLKLNFHSTLASAYDTRGNIC